MPKFFNQNPYSVELVGPKGERTVLKSKTTVDLSDYYMKYVKSNFISLVGSNTEYRPQNININTKIGNTSINGEIRRTPLNRNKIKLIEPKFVNNKQQNKVIKVVGKTVDVDPKQFLDKNKNIRISNGVAIGVFAYKPGLLIVMLVI
jgi:hypothetical protein